MNPIFALFVLPYFLATLFTPVVRRIAVKYNIVATPNHRTVHNGNIPKLGGIAIFCAYLITLFVAVKFNRDFFDRQYLGILIGATIILILGIVDDVKKLNCYGKFPVQFVAAIIAILWGCRFSTIVGLFGNSLDLGLWGIPLTVLWIVGITNALNLLDGLDGLATGVGFIAALTMLAVSLQLENLTSAISAMILAGALLGFLNYNSHPAKIFLGDTGSMFLGFLLACLTLKGSSQGVIIVPVLVLALPIIDTVLALIRRYRKKVCLFEADKEHIHHKLLTVGMGYKKAVLLLYLISAFFGVTAYLALMVGAAYKIFLLLVAAAIVAICVHELGYSKYFFVNGRKKV